MIRQFLRGFMAASMLAASTMAPAQSAWPEREITLTVMYGAGGNTDLMTRLLAKHLEAELGKPVVVLNKVGAMGTLGPDFVSRQKPDGYNLGIVSASTVGLAPQLVPVKFTLDDFEFAAAFANPRFGIAVRADSPYKTMQDLLAAGRKGDVFFASGAALNSLNVQNIANAGKSKFGIANYKSGAEVSAALLGGQVQAILGNPSDILPHVPTGKMRLLASVGASRWPEAPDAPTVTELGVPALAESWTGVAAPKGTPKEIVKKLEAAVLAIAARPEFQEALSKLGNDSLRVSGADFQANVKRRAAEWGELLKTSGLQK